MWAKSYGRTKGPQVDDDTLDLHTVANILWKVTNHNFHAKGERLAKGSFGPAFVGEKYQHARSEVQDS